MTTYSDKPRNDQDNPDQDKKPADGVEKRTGKDVDHELFEGRVILISADVDPKLTHSVNSKLLAMERHNPKEPITLFINCPGGEVHSGFAIFDCARFIQPRVITVVTGLAASMGSIISLCAAPEDRYSFPNSKFLIHQPSVSGIRGSVSDIEIHANDLLETKDRIIELYQKECGRTADEVKKALDRDKWMTPNQAKEWGHITKIISQRSELKL